MRAILKVERDTPENFDPGPAPMLEWIKIERLMVDDSYQRDLKKKNWDAIRRIAARFRWSRFSPVFVAPIEGGLYAVIDGQHRTHAAAMCGIEAVPCQIVQMTHSEQAESFAAVNGMVTKVTSANLFKAALTGGEEWAVEARRVVEAAGCELMAGGSAGKAKSPGQIFGPSTVKKLIAERGPDRIGTALKILKMTEGFGDTPEAWDMSVLAPMVRALSSVHEALADPHAPKIIAQFDYWQAIENIGIEVKRKLRLGLPTNTRKDQLEVAFQFWLEQKFVRAS
jgi:hypothetical protein